MDLVFSCLLLVTCFMISTATMENMAFIGLLRFVYRSRTKPTAFFLIQSTCAITNGVTLIDMKAEQLDLFPDKYVISGPMN